MPCFSIGEFGVGLGIHNEEFGVFLVHTIALGRMYMQFTKQATKVFVLVSSEYLIAEDENMMFEECVLDCCK